MNDASAGSPLEAPDVDQAQDGPSYPAPKPIIEYPDGTDEAFFLAKFKHLNSSFDTWFNPKYLRKIQDNYRIWEGKTIEGMLKNSTSIPTPNSVVEVNQARMFSAIGTREKLVDALPKSPDMVLAQNGEKNQKVEDLINESIITTPDYADKIDELLKAMWLETLMIAEEEWTEEEWTDYVPDIQLDTMSGMPVAVGTKEVQNKRGRPNMKPSSIRDWAWDPREKIAIENSPWLRKRIMVSQNELLRMQAKGVVDNVEYAMEKATKVENKGMDTAKDPDAKQASVVENTTLPAVGFDDGVYQLDQWQISLAWKDSEGKFQLGDFWIWCLGEECIIKLKPNPLKPVRKTVITAKVNRKPGMVLALGPIDVIKSMVIDLANTMVYWNKLVKRAANTPTFYTPASGVDGRRKILEENDMVPVMSIAGIKDGEVPVQAIAMVQQKINFLIGQIKDATAANEQAQGISGEKADTATEANILAGASNLRFQYQADMVTFTFYSKLAQRYFWMWKQFGIPGKMVVREGGIDGQATPVSLEDLVGDYEFRGIASQGQSAKLKRAELLMTLTDKMAQAQTANPLLFTNEQGQPMAVNFFDFYKNHILPMMDVKSSQGLFKPAPLPMLPPLAGPGVEQGAPQMGAAPDSAMQPQEAMA